MINFTAWPEMLAWPYLILKGWLPYKDIAIAHTPLMLYELALFYKIFGVGIMQLKIYTWLLVILNSGLLYFVAKEIYKKKVALISLLLYLPLVIVFEGNGLWFELALTPYAIFLFYLLKKKEWMWSGIVFVLGFLTKQTFVYFLLPIFVLYFSKKIKLDNLRKIIIGSGAALLSFLFLLLIFGIADDFYYWAVNFGVFYLPKAGGQMSLPSIKQFLFAFSPFVFSIFTPELIPWVIAGVMGVYPRWGLFHFQAALPFLAISLSLILASKKDKYIKYVVVIFMSLFLIIGIKRQLGFTTRFLETDVVKAINIINNQEDINNIYVVNYWDNIYALTETVPSTKPLIPYIPWYLDYEDDKKLILDKLKLNFPGAIVVKDRNDLNWKELKQFVEKYYTCQEVEDSVEVCLLNND